MDILISVLVSVLIGAAIPIFMQWRDNKEKYQQMVFEKRLQVHQEAYALCDKIRERIVLIVTPGYPGSDECSAPHLVKG
jgi:hypothetical protein